MTPQPPTITLPTCLIGITVPIMLGGTKEYRTMQIALDAPKGEVFFLMDESKNRSAQEVEYELNCILSGTLRFTHLRSGYINDQFIRNTITLHFTYEYL